MGKKSWNGKVVKPGAGKARNANSLKRQLEAAKQNQALGDAKLRALEAESRVKDLQLQAERSSGKRSLVEGVKVALPIAVGVGAGVKIAQIVGKRLDGAAVKKVSDFVAVAKRIDTLRKAGASAVGTRNGDKIAALVNEAYHLGGQKMPLPTGQIRGPVAPMRSVPLFKGGKLGGVIAVGLIAEGLASRYLATKSDGMLKEGLAMQGTGAMVAGAAFATARKVAMAGANLRPPGVEVAKVTAAHNQILREAGTLSKARALGGKLARGAFKLALPLTAAMAGVAAFRSSAKAGEGFSKALAKGVAEGGISAADGITFGAITAIDSATRGRPTISRANAGAVNAEKAMAAHLTKLGLRKKSAGGEYADRLVADGNLRTGSKASWWGGGVIAAGGAMLTSVSKPDAMRGPGSLLGRVAGRAGLAIGVAGMALGVAGMVMETKQSSSRGRLAIASGAARRANAAARSPVIGLRSRAVSKVKDDRGDGRVDSYYRQQNGQSVFVQGYARAP